MGAKRDTAVKLAAAVLIAVLAAASVQAAVIKDLARVYGPMQEPVVGYGLVVGLTGTGDDVKFAPAIKQLSNMLTNLGAGSLPIEVKGSKNVALVMVSGTLPAFARIGDHFDVEVSALGNAKSLAGGELVVCPLLAPDPVTFELVPYAIASGGVKADDEHPTRATASQGAIVQRAVPYELTPGNKVTFKLLPQNAGYSVAMRIVNAIHQNLNIDIASGAPGVAKAVDAATIEVTLTPAQMNNPVAFISQLERITVPMLDDVMEAKVVIDEKKGTFYAMNGNVEVSQAVVGYGNIQIEIRPKEGEASTTLDDLLGALKSVNATTQEVARILKALTDCGALHAKVELR